MDTKVKQLPCRLSSSALKRARLAAALRRTPHTAQNTAEHVRRLCAVNPSATWRLDSVLSIPSPALALFNAIHCFRHRGRTANTHACGVRTRVMTPVVVVVALSHRTVGRLCVWNVFSCVCHTSKATTTNRQKKEPQAHLEPACLMCLLKTLVQSFVPVRLVVGGWWCSCPFFVSRVLSNTRRPT